MPHRFLRRQSLLQRAKAAKAVAKVEGSGRNSFDCDLNLRPFGNWLEDSPCNAEESGLFWKKLELPLKISERAWWLKVSLLSKNNSGVKGSGPLGRPF